MLSVAAMSGWSGTYYTNLAREDYYLEGGEPDGLWFGKGAQDLGLTGTVQHDQFHNLLSGFAPDDPKKKLVQNAGSEDRDPGWDGTLSVPKSVSAIWANGDKHTRTEIQEATQAAAKKVVEYWEDAAAFTRMGKGGRERVPANLVVAMFEHGTSRSQDPNLHVHCLVLNVCTGPDGKTRTIESWPLYKHKMAAGALFRAHLSYELEQRLGLQSERKESWFEIKDVPKELMAEYSTRRKEIEEMLSVRGESSAAASAIAALVTRTAKDQPARGELLERWQEIGKRYGFTAETIRSLRQELPQVDRSAAVADCIAKAVDRVTQHEAYFSERDLVRYAAENAQGRGLNADFILASVKHHLEHSTEIERLHDYRAEKLYTTKEILAQERQVLETAKNSLGKKTISVSERSVRDALRTINRKLGEHNLTDEQVGLIRHCTQGRGTIKVTSGFAGTGKSSSLAACRLAFENDGYKVLGVTLAGRTAQQLEEDTGIKTRTIASLLYQLDMTLQDKAKDFVKHQAKEYGKNALRATGIPFKLPRHRYSPFKLTKDTVLVVDEAGMVGTKQLAALTKHAQRAGAKVILSGDALQLQPIEAGGMFARLGQELGEERLTQIIRQRDGWARDAVKDFARGDAAEALRAYAKRGLVSVSPTQREAMKELVKEWSGKGLAKPEENLIFASTNLEATNINRMCQAEMRVRENQVDPKGIQVGSEKFHVNDRVLFTRKEKRLGIENGHLGTVIGLDERLQSLIVRLDNGKTVNVLTEQYDKIKLGWAVTTHKGQGGTFDNVYVLAGGQMTDRHMAYVQGSRSRNETRFYTSRTEAGRDLETLAKNMSRDRQKKLAHDFLQPHVPKREQHEQSPTLSRGY